MEDITWETIEKDSEKKKNKKLSPDKWKGVIQSIVQSIVILENQNNWDKKWQEAFINIKERNITMDIPFSDEDIEMLYTVAVTDKKEELRIAQEADNKIDKLVFKKSSDIVSKPIDWLWQDKIAKGKVTLIAGDPGLGKSQTTIHIAGVVSTGGVFPGGHECKKGKVLFFSAEDDPEDTINPRLQAVGADGENIFIFSIVRKAGKEKSFDLSKDMDLLTKTIEDTKDVSLIIVDPITAFLGETDSHVNAEVRALLSMLSKLASQYGIAVIVVTHLNKSTGGSPLNKITGSLAFVAAARAAYMVIKDENDEKRRLFLPVKNNLAEDRGGFAFRVEGVELPNNIFTSKVIWEETPVTISAIEAMRNNKDEGGVDSETVHWLEDYLRKYPEGVSFDILTKEAIRQGISKSTLYRADKKCFIDKIYVGKNKPKIWKIIFDEGNE